MAVHVDFAGLIDASKDWIELGVKAALVLRPAAQDGRPGRGFVNVQVEDPETKLILETIRDAAELLKGFRGYTSATYVEGKALVTHAELRVGDVAR
jgi:hypothetical protein